MKFKFNNMLPLIWVVFIDSLGWGIAFSVFAALILDSRTHIFSAHASDSLRYITYESLLGIYCFFTFFFAPVLGGIADRFGRKPGLAISMLGLTSGFLFCALGAYFHSLICLFLGRIISGATAGSVSIAQAAVVDISTAKTKSFNLSVLMFANTIGFSLGPVVGSIIETIKIVPVGTLTFSVGAAMSLAAYISIVFGFQEMYQPKKEAFSKKDIAKDFLNIKIAFSKPLLKNYLWAILFSMTSFGLLFSNIPIFLTEHFALSTSLIGIILSSQSIVFSIALLLSSKFIFKLFNKENVVITTQILQLLIYIFLSVATYYLVRDVVLFSFMSMLTGTMYIGLLTLISDAASDDWQGRVMGVSSALASITWGVGPILSGVLNHIGSNAVFSVGALLMIIGLLVLIFKKKTAISCKNRV